MKAQAAVDADLAFDPYPLVSIFLTKADRRFSATFSLLGLIKTPGKRTLSRSAKVRKQPPVTVNPTMKDRLAGSLGGW